MNMPYLLTVLIVLFFSGCGDSTNADGVLPTTAMQLGGKTYVLEKAITAQQQQNGLMHRDPLADGHGMIFPFDTDRADPFWNHDVRFALDVVYVDSAGKIASIQQMPAYSEATTNPVMARYVIELNEGTAKALGLKEGDQLAIPDNVKKK